MNAKMEWAEYHLDGKTFQLQLGALADTIALKVQREGRQSLPQPEFVIADIYVLIRQAHYTYDLFCFMNADDRRKNDPDWRVAYSVVILPLVRCMIDCLYNITAILTNPGPKGFQFRESGFRQMLEALSADEERYAGDPKWDAYIREFRELIALQMRANGITMEAVTAAQKWRTLGRYLKPTKNAPLTPHQEFLKKFTFGIWREYSAIAHGTFEGLMRTASFYMGGDVPHDDRPRWEEAAERMIAMTVARVAAILLCLLTEVQVYFSFEGARINQRLNTIWDALIVVPEIKELYDGRYAELMQEKGLKLA